MVAPPAAWARLAPPTTGSRHGGTLVCERMWHTGLLASNQQGGVDWAWQALDGAMTNVPLGGGNRSHPDRPQEPRHQPQPADHWLRYAARQHGRRGQSAQPPAGAAHPGHKTDGASPADGRAAAAPLPGYGRQCRRDPHGGCGLGRHRPHADAGGKQPLQSSTSRRIALDDGWWNERTLGSIVSVGC